MGIKFTQQEIIGKFKSVHGEEYDYSFVQYVNMNTPIKVVCHKHTEPYLFFPFPSAHVKGTKCPKCTGVLKMATEDFIKRAREVHGDLYDYSKVDYVNAHTKVTITCPVHGEWESKPNNHLNGKGCGRCAQSVLKSQDEIISEFAATHGDAYDYSNVLYVGVDVPVKIRCKLHDTLFEQTPRSHKNGSGCPECAREVRASKRRIDVMEAVRRSVVVHGDTYDYSSVSVTNNPLTITVKCKAKGHTITQPLFTHLGTKGCPVCSGRTYGDVNLLIGKFRVAHGDSYDYSLVTEHVGAKEKVKIICKKHGIFEQEVSSHSLGAGCPSCGRQDSKAEVEIFEFVQALFPDAERRNRSLIGKELDIYIPSKRFAIEYNGLYWHSDNPQNSESDARNRHKVKTDLCKEAGIHLFHLYEDDWLNRPEVVKHTLKHLLGTSEKRIYARNTVVKTHKLPEATDFYNSYHMQGAPKQGLFVYALYTNGELVAAMTFSKPASERGNTEQGRYELLRYACKYSVVGGASKLLKAFINENNPSVVVSYSDDGMFSGNMYSLLGFKQVGKVPPDYRVIVGKERKHKSNFRREKLAKILGDKFNPELSERDNCHANGLYRIYNSGLTKWELSLTQNKNYDTSEK